MSLLYLQPDRRQELMEQGEDPEFGNPHSIRGSVPERTKKLLDDLISESEAIKDEARSTPELTVWRGNIGGGANRALMYNQEIQLHKGSEVQRIPCCTCMRVVQTMNTKNHPRRRMIVLRYWRLDRIRNWRSSVTGRHVRPLHHEPKANKYHSSLSRICFSIAIYLQ